MARRKLKMTKRAIAARRRARAKRKQAGGGVSRGKAPRKINRYKGGGVSVGDILGGILTLGLGPLALEIAKLG